uniref:Putative carotene beta-ring hydroxylase n=1 Tax=uncultured bacterium CSL142 TaxID=1091569 RepID=G4WVL4_9BACT|nr:putative carotene beta-ring hydroxylase [uncultured bacterium CSL142]
MVHEPIDVGFADDLLGKLSSLFAQYGDAFRVFSPITQSHIYVLSHPDHARHVLVTHHDNYTKGIGIERVGILLGNGIMVSEGELWRRQRKMIQPAFHRSVISGMLQHIAAANLQLSDKWVGYANRKQEINVTQEMSEITLRVVLRAIFGPDIDKMSTPTGANPFSLLTEETERNLAFAYKFRLLTKLVMECVDRRRTQNEKHSDLLGVMMAARDRKSGEPMADRQLLDEVMTLIVAGHETTASALNWMWYLLSQNPEIEKRLHQEVDNLQSLPITLEDTMRFAYTRQVIEETLRLYPPGWLLTRRSIEADNIGGYSIAPKTEIFISPYLLHRHPQFWDQPERFDPDRFEPDRIEQRNRFVYLPFALGPRACIGEHFAMAEMVLHTALLARRVHLHYVPKGSVELEGQVNLRSKHHIYMQLEIRRP